MSRVAELQEWMEFLGKTEVANRDLPTLILLRDIALSLAVIADSINHTEEGGE